MHRRIVRPLSVLASCALVTLLLATASAGGAAAGTSCGGTGGPAPTAVRHGAFLGVVPKAAHAGGGVCAATTVAGGTPSHRTSSKFRGRPPLIDGGGPVMGAPTPGEVTITPVYWGAPGAFDASYEGVVDQYLSDVAHDSGSLTNVYSVDLQLGIHYSFSAGTPISDTDSYPASGCTRDTRQAYGDGSFFDSCLTDSQLQSELASYVSAHGLPSDIAHLYLIMLPKGVESCFVAGSGASSNCSTPWAAGFCGYHSFFGASDPPVYADIPYPSYGVPGAFTCATQVESLNGNTDADVVLSIVSHEVNEAVTDPYGSAWFDARGYEIGDECGYLYGLLQGSTAGAQWNQTIDGHHYFTQEEASNEDFAHAKRRACVQAVDLPFVSLKVKPRSPKAGISHPVTLDGHKSEAGGATYTWDFGDGSPTVSGSSNRVTHVYPVTGGVAGYTVTLTITDDVGLQHTTASLSQAISVTG